MKHETTKVRESHEKRSQRFLMVLKTVSFSGVLLFLLAVLALLSGCSSPGFGPELDTSLLTDDPCAAPCWNNITPGVSDEIDVHRQLEHSPFVRKGSVEHGLTEQAGIPLTTFSWWAQGKPKNWIYLRDGKVLRIHITLDYALTLGEIVDKYGPPEVVSAALDRSGFLEYAINVDYPTKGLLFSTTSHPFDPDAPDAGKRVVLSEDIVMTHVLYFAPTSLDGMLSEVSLLSPDLVEYLVATSQEWQGFGPIDLAEE